MTDLDDRFEAYVFALKRERIVQKWRVIQCQFVTLFSGNGIIPKTAVGDGKLTQSFGPESLPSGGPFTIWECAPLLKAILNQNLASLYHLEPPFLGL